MQIQQSQQQKKDFLIRGIPIELYNLLSESASAHHRSRTQEAIDILSQALTPAAKPLKKPTPFSWGKAITNEFIEDAINEGR